MDFDSKNFNLEFLSTFPEQQVYPEHFDRLLTDFILLFAASDIARYRPQLWEQILAGLEENEAKFNKRMKVVYEMISIGNSAHFYLTYHYQIWAEFLKLLLSK
jgi:hypothetical protein